MTAEGEAMDKAGGITELTEISLRRMAQIKVDYGEESHPRARLLDYTGQLVVECPSPPECMFVAWSRMSWEKVVGLFR